MIYAYEAAIQRQFPRVLAAMFSKKKPADAPIIPDYDTFILRYNKEKNESEHDAEEFRTDAWWLDKDKKSHKRHAEVRAGGEKALNHELPDAMNVEPQFDEETEEVMRQFYYGHDEEIE